MSQEFLVQLLTSDNRVTSGPRQTCHICLQECDTISTETGIIECPIRLPCSHVIGSACIAKWLRTNNTCPICRHKFFPAQSPTSDSDSDDEENEEDEEELGEDIAYRITDICNEFGRELRFSSSMHGIVEQMAVNVYSVSRSESHTGRCAVAVTVHMVSHIMSEIQSLDEISRVSNISILHLREAYRFLYPHREALVPPDLPAELPHSRDSMRRLWPILPALTPENGFTEREGLDLTDDVEMKDADNEENDDELNREESLIQSKEFCEEFCIVLGYDEDVIEICQSIARNVHGGCLQDRRFPRRTAAVCVFMASHLADFHSFVDFQTSVELICNVVGVSEAALRDDYAIVYDCRREVVDAEMLECIGNIDNRRALQAMAPLAWPAL